MGKLFNEFGSKILTIIGVIATVALVLLIGNNVVELRNNEKIEAENQPQYTTTTTQPKSEEVDSVALPDVIYASVNQPLLIRFMNITGYNSLEDFTIKVETGGKGKVYNDRWEYTPTSEETVNLSFEVTDKDGVKVNESSHTIMVKRPVKEEELSVLVIGDSTIEAGRETEQMLKMAKENGYSLKLLGSVSQDWLKDENNRHEGRGGWRAETYAEKISNKGTEATNAFYNPETKCFDFSYYMNAQGYESVDVVCLQLGINDVFGAATDAELHSSYSKTYLRNMDKIIESIHTFDPAIKIVWNLILPCSVEQEKFELAYDNGQTADRCKKNTYLTNLEIVKHAAGMENVFAAPTNAVLDTENNMGSEGNGAVHPGLKGYYEIGAMLYSYIRAIS